MTNDPSLQTVDLSKFVKKSIKDNLRPVSYKEYDTWQQGWCQLITGGMMSEPEMIVERHDGTLTCVSLSRVQFNDRVNQ